MENKKISLGQTGGKEVDFKSFLPTKQQKKTENTIEATNFGLKLFTCTSKFPHKFKQFISLILWYVELIM